MIERFSPKTQDQIHKDPKGQYVKYEIVKPLLWALNGIIEDSIDGAAIAIAEEALRVTDIDIEKIENI